MALDNNTPALVFVIIALVALGMGLGAAYLMDPFKISDVANATVFWTAVYCYGLQWIVFIPALIWRTEKFFDLTGSITYLTATGLSLGLSRTFFTRQIIASSMCALWATRLGMFLLTRVCRDGKDGRFDEIKKRAIRFFNVWTIQGLWVFFTACPVYLLNSKTIDTPLGVVDYVGIAVWTIGFLIEVVADGQKKAFAANPDNKGKFIDVGLWYVSQHPNYFGEISLWVGMLILCSPTLKGTEWACVISPLVVMFLLCKVSGLPMLDARALAKWGDNEDYMKYRRETSVLIPLPRGSCFGSSPDKDAAIIASIAPLNEDVVDSEAYVPPAQPQQA